MLINTENYFEYISKLGVGYLSVPVKKMHDLITKVTDYGKDWSKYQQFKSAWDKQFEAVEILWNQKKKRGTPEWDQVKNESAAPEKTTAPLKPYKVPGKKSTSPKPGKKTAPVARKKFKITRFKKPKVKGKSVEDLSHEVKFIKRFALLHGKQKNRQQVLAFIKAIQKAIIERKIRKTSKYAGVIRNIQSQLVKAYNGKAESIGFKFTEADYVKYLKMAGAEHLMLSVRFIKSYINMLGSSITKQKAARLLERITATLEKKQITSDDKYIKPLRIAIASIERFLKSGDSPTLTEAELNGLEGAFEACGCRLHGFEESYGSALEGVEDPGPESQETPRHTILNSKEVLNLKQDKLDFQGKWLDFIGNPTRGFTMMIYGKPKFGKSYLAVDLAGYLARNHGKVLYVAVEEGFDDTLQDKLREKNVADDRLFVADYLPKDLSGYDFVFLDSINRLDLSPDDVEKLESKYPAISFVYVFQTNKGGDFKGSMEFKHNVDCVIEVPEKGLAIQYGRYNQGGDMRIFENQIH